MKRTWVRFEAVMTQGSEGKMAALHQENPEGEKRGTERLKEALNCAVVNPKVKSMMKQIGMEDGKILMPLLLLLWQGLYRGHPVTRSCWWN